MAIVPAKIVHGGGVFSKGASVIHMQQHQSVCIGTNDRHVPRIQNRRWLINSGLEDKLIRCRIGLTAPVNLYPRAASYGIDCFIDQNTVFLNDSAEFEQI